MWVPLAGAGLLLLGFVTRLGYGFEWDELQILHGAWNVAHGLTPYRDYFEHHPPLMPALVAPMVVGQTELSWRLLVGLRLVVLAVVLAVGGCAVRLLRRTTADGAPWMVLALLAVCPVAGKLFELRADWPALLCVLGAMLLVTGPPRSFLGGGTLVGLAVCLTQKAIVTGLALVAWTALASPPGGAWRPNRERVRRAAVLVAGGLVAPALVAASLRSRVPVATLIASVIGVNLDWPREVDWRELWNACSLAALGPLVVAVAAAVRIALDGFGGRRVGDAEALVAFVALAGLPAFLATPVAWEQSLLFFVAPWVGFLAVTALARYARTPAELRRDRWILSGAAAVLLGSLTGVLAVRAAAVWGVATVAALVWAFDAADERGRLRRALCVLVLPGLVLFARDRAADATSGRGAAQARFARAVGALAPPGAPVLMLWDHVLPFRPSASYHWFAHAGVLRRFPPGHPGAPDLDAEYADAVERGRAAVVVADGPALAESLPGLARALARRCRLAVPGYDGSDGWSCAPPPEAAAPAATAPPDAPDVVLVVVDSLRADHVSSYGYSRPTTPHLDALAREGVLFENAVSQAPWTGASVASLLTGLQPSVHGLDAGPRWVAMPASGGLPFVVQRKMHGSAETLPEVLRAHGYRTAGFVSNVYLNSVFGFGRGFDVYQDDHADYSEDVLLRKRRGDETNRRVAAWLATRPREPFFLLVHYNDPHWPYDPPPPHGAAWVAGYRGPLTPEDTAFVAESEGRVVDLDRKDLEYLVGLYDGEVAFADANVGALFAQLRGAGLQRSVLAVVTADHGEEFLDHGSTSHGYTLFEEQLHVPLVMRLPGVLPARRVRQQVRLIDVMPTVLDLAGIGGDETRLQGESLAALARGSADHGPGDAFSEAPLRGALRSLRTGTGWKLVEDLQRGGRLVFDLVRDPHERTDLSARDPAAARALARRAARQAAACRARRATLDLEGPTPAPVVVDEALRKRLEALGYVAPAGP
jgi:arylsulfatase A-like enzyme